jgi:ubiquinone biosynthesis protein COQ4
MKPLITLRAIRAVARLVKDPARLDEVFRLVDAIESPELVKKFDEQFGHDPAYAPFFRSRPRMGEVDVATLAAMPEGTLGRAFGDFLVRNGLDPKDIEVNPVENDFDFMRAHLRESHDVWHVVTGFSTDIAGELGLQAFYLAQIHAPLASMLLAIGMLNTFFYAMDDRDARMRAIVRGWTLGKRARPLFGFRWAESWSRPLAEVQRELGLDLSSFDAGLDALLTGERAETMLRAA